MTRDRADRSTRLVRWWTRRYTSGLAPSIAEPRRVEIDSDLAEHASARRLDGWSERRIARERAARLARGMAADVGWRHDVLIRRCRAPGLVRGTLVSVTSLAGGLLGAFCVAFACYVLGTESLSERRFLGGFDSYADEVGRRPSSMIAAAILATLGVVLVVAAVARPVSPVLANAITIAIAVWAVLWFWLGVWPLGLVVVIGSGLDLAVRAQDPVAQG